MTKKLPKAMILKGKLDKSINIMDKKYRPIKWHKNIFHFTLIFVDGNKTFENLKKKHVNFKLQTFT